MTNAAFSMVSPLPAEKIQAARMGIEPATILLPSALGHWPGHAVDSKVDLDSESCMTSQPSMIGDMRHCGCLQLLLWSPVQKRCKLLTDEGDANVKLKNADGLTFGLQKLNVKLPWS